MEMLLYARLRAIMLEDVGYRYLLLLALLMLLLIVLLIKAVEPFVARGIRSELILLLLTSASK